MNRRELIATAVAAPLLLRDAPEALARRLGGTPLALVTADAEARVVAVDLTTGRRAQHLPTLPGPRSIESIGGRAALIAHTERGAVTLLDSVNLRTRAVLRDFAEPRYAVAGRGGRFAYVTDSRRAELVTVDVARARVVHREALGGAARHLAIAPTGRTLWISLGTKAERIAIVDLAEPARPRHAHTLTPPFLVHDVGFEPDGQHVWVTSGDRGALLVYHARTGRIVRRLGAGAPPQHVTFLGGRAHVTSGDDGTLSVHRLRDGRVVARARVPVGSYNVQEGWGVVLTPSLTRGTLCVLDAQGRIRRYVGVARSSHDACFVMAA